MALFIPLLMWVTFVQVLGGFHVPVQNGVSGNRYFQHSRSTAVTRLAGDETCSDDDDNVITNHDDSAPEKGVPSYGTWNPLRLAVLKLGMTELRFTSPLNYEKRDGIYKCANCGANLFDSAGKYDSGSGWPSFWKTSEGRVSLFREWDGRIECRCQRCSGHLGHVFPDGPRRNDVSAVALESIPESDLKVSDAKIGSRLPRYCMNGASLRFEPVTE